MKSAKVYIYTLEICLLYGSIQSIQIIIIQESCPLGLVSMLVAHLSLSLWLSQTRHIKLEGVPKSLKGCRKPYRVFGMGMQNLPGCMELMGVPKLGSAKLPVTLGS